jgi:hypothetical protein
MVNVIQAIFSNLNSRRHSVPAFHSGQLLDHLGQATPSGFAQNTPIAITADGKSSNADRRKNVAGRN